MNLKDKPSDVLEQALEELVKCETNPDFYIDMSEWVYPHANHDKCSVCLAGALMMRGKDVKTMHSPQYPGRDFPTEAHKLYAVDAFRTGRVWAGCASFNNPSYTLVTPPLKVDGIPQYFPVCDYEEDPAEFKANIRDIIHMLKDIGQ